MYTYTPPPYEHWIAAEDVDVFSIVGCQGLVAYGVPPSVKERRPSVAVLERRQPVKAKGAPRAVPAEDGASWRAQAVCQSQVTGQAVTVMRLGNVYEVRIES